MQVIAKTGQGFLIEASEDEIAQLHGYDSSYDSDYRKQRGAGIGDTIVLDRIVKSAKYVRTLDAAVLEQSHERLLTMADRLSDIRELVHKLNLFEDLKKQEE